jgi:dipeptidyl-peptidase-4
VPGFFAAAIAQQPLTPEELVHNPNLFADPPENIAWSPDGSKLVYIDSQGELMQVAAATATQTVLVSRDKMQVLNEPATAARDRERRARYHEPDCIWAPDSKHLLFDSNGALWFFGPEAGTGLQVASTGSGSGNNPQFSPDGAYLSYIHDHNVYVRKLSESEIAVKLSDSPSPAIWNGAVDWVYEEELDAHSNYFWAPDSKHVAYLQMNESTVPRYPLVEWSPAHAKVLPQPYPQPGDPNPTVRVGVVTPGGGKTKWIEIPLHSGDDYIPRFGWVDAKTLWIETLTRDQQHLTVYFADIATDAIQTAFTKSDEKYLEPSYDLTILAGKMLVTGWKDGHEHLYLYSFDPANPLGASARFEKQLTSGDWDVEKVAAVDLQGNVVYYLSNEGDPRQRQLWAIKLDGTGKHQVSSSGEWHDPVFSPGGRTFADTFSSLRTPPVLELCHQEAKCAALWKPERPAIEAPPATQLELRAADNKTVLYGELVLPASGGGEMPHSVPLIMNPYGGPEVQAVTDEWDPRSALFDLLLAQHGFAVLRVDNRGMGGRGREFAQAAYGDFGKVQLADQMAALDQVLAQFPQLDPARIGWWGWSWGGTFTLYAMTHSKRILAGAAVAPVTNWEAYDSIYTERYLGSLDVHEQAYRENSVAETAGALSGHLLLAQGTSDENVHFGNSIELAAQLNRAGIHYDLAIFPGEMHNISGADARTDLYRRILGHFELYLKNPSAAAAGNGEHPQ